MSSNNFKTKEMFFGQYFGQKVFCDSSVGRSFFLKIVKYGNIK
jgi:hypothetical protein